jgi:hypothetical protein
MQANHTKIVRFKTMKGKRIRSLIVAASTIVAAPAFAATPGDCDATADYCLVDDFGTVFNLWLEPDTTIPSPRDGGFVGYADVSDAIFPPDGLLCPVSGSYTQVGSAGNEEYWNAVINSGCSCDEDGNPAKRVVLLTLDTSETPARVVDGNLMTAHADRCDGSTDVLRGSLIGTNRPPTTTDFTPTTTPDF